MVMLTLKSLASVFVDQLGFQEWKSPCWVLTSFWQWCSQLSPFQFRMALDDWLLRATQHPNLPAGSPTSWMEILGWEVVPNSPKTEQWPDSLISDKHIPVKLFGSKFESRPIAHRFFIFGTIMSLFRITLAGLDLRFLQTDPPRWMENEKTFRLWVLLVLPWDGEKFV